MQFVIRGKNIEVTEAIRECIINSLEKISKYKIINLDDTIHVEVRTYKENLSRVRVVLDLKGKSNHLQAEGQHIDLYVAIDEVRHKLEEQLRRMKDRWIPRGKEKFTKVEFPVDLTLDEDI